jgi:phospholipid/cholesterol/gamma-HCH transport system permease protein
MFAPAVAVANVGRATRRMGARTVDRVYFVGAAARAAVDQPPSFRPIAGRILLNQIRFTAVQALPFLGSIAAMIGIAVMVQVSAQAARFGISDVLGPIVVSVIVRELGPLLTAIVVIGRSGTAIAAELSTNTVLGETEALESMGIDPLQHFVLPRIIGMTISVTLLTIFFDAIALLAGALVGEMVGVASAAVYMDSLQRALQPADLWLTVLKGSVFGAGIAVLCSYEGLNGGQRATAIPQCVTRGVVGSLFFVFTVSVLFSIAFYL